MISSKIFWYVTVTVMCTVIELNHTTNKRRKNKTEQQQQQQQRSNKNKRKRSKILRHLPKRNNDFSNSIHNWWHQEQKNDRC